MKNKYKTPILYKITRPIIKGIMKLFFGFKIIGKEYIPTSGRVVLAGNHTNNLDCWLLMSCTKRCIHFLAKKELLEGPKKIVFANMGIIPVDRKIHDKNSLIEAENHLNKENVIGIFPEGTFRGKKGTLLPFKIGAVKMAYDTNTSIVPFSIIGEYKFFRRNLKIKFSKPIKIKNSDLDKENDKLRNKIISMIEEG